MKKLIILVLLSCSFFEMHAQTQTSNDSLAYQLQRKKINSMLAQRKLKFGQYDQSLSMHTGIFGLQTKKDIRRSNDILMDIVKTDNEIFVQLKILLDYRTFQQTQVQNHSKEAESSNMVFMHTINKLQRQVDVLKQDEEKQRKEWENTRRTYLIACLLMLASILYLIIKKPRVKANLQ